MKEKYNILEILEAILFVFPNGISLNKIAEILNKKFGIKVKEKDLEKYLHELKKKKGNSIYKVEEHYGKWRLTLKDDLQKVFIEFMVPELPTALINVLAVVASKYPVKQSELVELFGNRVYTYVKKLIEMGFIKAKKSGKTLLLYPTPYFFKYFEIKDKERNV